jgi:hypothetical protein
MVHKERARAEAAKLDTGKYATNTGTILSHALAYAARGWPVFPCKKNKRPFTDHGFKEASTDPDTIKAWWRQHPHAQVAIATGQVSGLWVLDLDCKPGDADGRDTLHDLEAQHGELPAGPAVTTQSGGEHYYFAWPADRDIRSRVRPMAGTDTRGNGGYVVVPPSPGYDWDNHPDEIELPQAPEWLLNIVCKPKASTPSSTSTTTTGTAEAITEGERNARLASEAGVLRHRGYSEEEILTTLRMLNAKWCKPPLDDAEVVKIAQSIARYEPAHVPRFLPTPEAEMEPAPKDAHPHPGEMPKGLLQPGGILQEVIDRTVSTAIHSQPAGALSMSLTLLGALAARKYATQTDLRTNLYTVFIAKSGTGKEHPRAVAKDLLHGGLKAFVGAESFASDSAVISQLRQHPAKLFMLDEMGKLMKAVLDPRSGAHLTNISKTFLELFSKANQIYRPKAYADSKNDALLEYPACCIYGTTTPSTIFEAMTPDNLSEGLVGRFLFFEAPGQRPKRQARNIATEAPADDLRQKLEKLEAMDLCRREEGIATIVPDTHEANQLIEAYRDKCEHEADRAEGDAYRAVWNRSAEHAYKVALIHALSAGEYAKPEGEQVIEAASMEYGIQLADYCTRLILHLAEANIAENGIDRNRKYLLDIIKRAGVEGITGNELANKARKLDAKGRKELLDDLHEQGRIRLEAIETGGRPAYRYFAR